MHILCLCYALKYAFIDYFLIDFLPWETCFYDAYLPDRWKHQKHDAFLPDGLVLGFAGGDEVPRSVAQALETIAVPSQSYGSAGWWTSTS